MTEVSNLKNLEMEQNSVQEFIERNKVWVNDTRTECGDGRYTKDQSRGSLRAFGADFGFLMAVKGALKTKDIKMSSEELIDKYFSAIKEIRGESTKFYYHTDSHHIEEGIGCGHVAQASKAENDGLYGALNSAEVTGLYYGVLERNSDELHKSVLEGEHRESAVLLVHAGSDSENPQWSVNSYDDNTDEMFFVVDIQRAGNFMEALSAKLGIPGLGQDDIKQAFIIQMQASALLLAKGKPQYRVSISGNGKVSVSLLATVQ